MQAGVADQLNRLGLRGKWSKEDAADAARACEAIVRSERALGQVCLLWQCPLHELAVHAYHPRRASKGNDDSAPLAMPMHNFSAHARHPRRAATERDGFCLLCHFCHKLILLLHTNWERQWSCCCPRRSS